MALFLWPTTGRAQTTAFTYQGRLTDAGNQANGNYDLQFKLFDTPTVGTGTQAGATLVRNPVAVSAGVFTVTLDFGANVFEGAARYLEIGVRPAGSANAYTLLAPRQPITATPYAIQTLNAQQLGGVAASNYLKLNASGNVGIGTPSPSTRLEVVHPATQLRFGPSTADNGGYLISTNPSQAIIAGGARWDGANWIARDTVASLTAHQNGVISFHTNDNSNLSVGSPFSPTERMRIDLNGNVGIGRNAPLYPLDVNGSVRSFGGASTDMVVQTAGGTNAWARLMMVTPSQQWSWGTSQNYNGNQLYLYDATFNKVSLTIQPNGGDIVLPLGNVGIGTTSPPNTKLFVDGGVGQSASSYGLPKFMLLVRNNGNSPPTIEKCYNAVSGSSTIPCGILSMNQPGGAGPINIRFPFRVTDRFFSMTLISSGTAEYPPSIVGFDSSDLTGQTVSVITQGEQDFYLIVF